MDLKSTLVFKRPVDVTVVMSMCVYLHPWNRCLALLVVRPRDRELQWHRVCQTGMGWDGRNPWGLKVYPN